MVTPEVISLLVAVVGLAGLLFRKSKCFIRHIGRDTDWGVGFDDPGGFHRRQPRRGRARRRKSPPYRNMRQAGTYAGQGSTFTDYLRKGTEVMTTIQAGVKLGQTVLPYLEPFIAAL